MQYLMIWGGTPAATVPAYRPLTDALIGKRWVFDPDRLILPAGFEGQIFRIDKHAPRAGDIAVSLVHLDRSWRDEKFAEGLSVAVGLPEAREFQKATWLAVESSDRPARRRKIERKGQSLLVHLPPVGAAGILRLSR